MTPALVRRVTVRSSFTPDVSYDPSAAAAGSAPAAQGGGVAGVLLGLVRPAVYVETLGGAVVPIEPYGPPNNYGRILGAALGGLALLGLAYVAKRALS